MTSFGRIVIADEVRDAVVAHAVAWLPTYLAELERQRGLAPEAVPRLRSIAKHNELTRWPEEQLPSLLAIAPGISEEPAKQGRGLVTATYVVGLSIVCSARDQESADKLANLYGAALRTLMVQQQVIDGIPVESVKWLSEEAGEVDDDQDRTLAAVYSIFAIDVVVMDASKGPLGVPAEPYADGGDLPTVQTVTNEAGPA